MKVDCLRIGALRLCLAMMLGLLVVPGYVVTSVLFAKAESSAVAGMLAGHLFHVANMGLLLLAVAVAFFWMRLAGEGKTIGRLRWLLLAAIALLVALNEFVMAAKIESLTAQVGAVAELAEDDPMRQTFRIWHGAASLMHLLATLAAVLLAALGTHSAAHRAPAGEA